VSKKVIPNMEEELAILKIFVSKLMIDQGLSEIEVVCDDSIFKMGKHFFLEGKRVDGKSYIKVTMGYEQ
jgi:hypothetical protein